MNKAKAAEALKSLEVQLKGGPGSGPRPRGGSKPSGSSTIRSNHTSVGFFGTMARHLRGNAEDGEDAEDRAGSLFSSAASSIVQEHKVDPKVARNYLDSTYGRHVADRVSGGSTVGQAMLNYHGTPAKVRAALEKIREWTDQGDIFDP